MKVFRQYKKTAVLPIILIGLSVICTEAFAANIKRSCAATYSATVDSVTFNSKKVGLPYGVVLVGAISDSFSAKAGCGKLVPNRCRKRARDKLLACARAHVKSPNQLPQGCQPKNIKEYPGANLQSIIKAKACKSVLGTNNHLKIRNFLPSQYQLNVLLKIHVRGSNDCGVKKPGTVMVDGKRHNRNGNTFFVTEPLKHFSVSCP